MGRYDDILAGLPAPTRAPTAPDAPRTSGKYDDILADLPRSKEVNSLANKVAWDEVNKRIPWNQLRAAMPKIAGAAAEKLGEMGVNPNVSAAVTLPVAMAPEIVSAGAALNGLYGNSAIAQGIRNTPKMLSPRYDALNEAAGISKNLPETVGRTARFPNLAGQPSNAPPSFAPAIAPKLYPKEPNAMLNFARSRIESLGDRLSPQELNDYKVIIGQMMDKGQFGGGGPLAVASKLKSQATELLNKSVPGRAELDEIYKISKTLRLAPEVAKKVWEYFGPKLRYGAGVIGVP